MKEEIWFAVKDLLPPENVVVDTKIDELGVARNLQPLKRCENLWFTPDSRTYVYYVPTHWKFIR